MKIPFAPVDREVDHDLRPARTRTGDDDLSAVRSHDRIDDGEPETRAIGPTRGERLERARDQIRWKPSPVVGDADLQATGSDLRSHGGPSPGLMSVLHQVGDGTSELVCTTG